MTETPHPYGDQPQTDFEAQLVRIFAAAGCATRAELAKLLEIKQAAIAEARRHGSIPPEWLLGLLETRGVNPEWIRTGQGGRLMRSVECTGGLDATPGGSPLQITAIERRPPEDCSTDVLLAEVLRRALKAAS